ncbi:hypothetical protein KQ940_05775 [Marinobacterium sp. D7]|uniref:CLCA_X family protein n=1 Tax=Marinobacterium ramblicola TaxID=2849041 RepID=UPI001C2D8494|nr:CLCA_X family protein [Marinobacterium ramblicola]MBV1787562.1 hypothetical protein [Marinobacterium ramblicola]
MKERDYYRNGPDHRAGREIDFALIRRHFDFKTIRIGRWVTPEEQRRAAIHFYDALCDLMAILRVPETVISLRGTLGLHYGTGGRPGVAAHYDAAQRVFALAKNAGPGSIAHEWFHAFDHYIARQAFTGQASSVFGSRAWLHDCEQVPHPLNQRLYACYHAIMLSADGGAPSELVQRSLEIDNQRGVLYYSLPEEVCARAFEAWVQDAALSNQFLVKGTHRSPEALSGLYPQGIVRQRINEVFGDYFYTLGRALGR